MKRIASFLEAILFSMANFAIIFYFGSVKDFEFIYYFGMSQTSALVFLSFYRNFLLLKIGTSVPLYSNSVLLSVFLGVMSFFVFGIFGVFDFNFFKLFAIVFLYNIVYESCRYQIGSSIFLSKVIFFLACSVALLAGWGISRGYILNLMFVEIIFCLLLLLVKNFGFYRTIDFRLMLRQELKSLTGLSLAQISIVHLPFFYLSWWCSKDAVALLFLYRSAFQLVQVILRSLEIKNVKIIQSGRFSFKSVRRSFVLAGMLFGVISFACFWCVEFFLGKKIDVPVIGFVMWYLIFIVVSYSRFYDLHVHYSKQYESLTKAYMAGAASSLFFTLLSVIIGINVVLENPSVSILVGWFFFAIISHINYKDMSRAI